MKVKVIKNGGYLAFFDDFYACPVYANSLKELKINVVNEVYRTCNVLEKRLPKNSNEVIVSSENQVDFNVKNYVNSVYEIPYDKKGYSEYKSQLLQGFFSIKVMLDSVLDTESAEDFVSGIKSVNSAYNLDNSGIIECGFNVLEVLDGMLEQNEVKAYNLLIKTFYFVVSKAKEIFEKHQAENITDSFYFGV